jgi:hypothetical protein
MKGSGRVEGMAGKRFNVTGVCNPTMHYMVDITSKIEKIIREYIEPSAYFVVNRARQFGKTTMLSLLEQRLQNEYITISISFEGKEEFFASQEVLAGGVCLLLSDALRSYNADFAALFDTPISPVFPLTDLSKRINNLCLLAERKIVVMIDEVDRASDYPVFAAFLGMLRDGFLSRNKVNGTKSFHSVILAGVHDIKNLKAKIRPDSEHAYNSPWNIAATFDVDMCYSSDEITTMLTAYEADYHTGMDVSAVASHVHYYTDGYPFLVSLFCKRIHDNGFEWSATGVDQAMRLILKEKNTLFDDIIKNLNRSRDFLQLIEKIVLTGAKVSYVADNPTLDLGMMYGILKEVNDYVQIANVVFMTRLK